MIARYSRPEMNTLWSEESKFALWLEVEIAALEAMVKLGIAPDAALRKVKEKAGFNVSRINEIEAEVKHDVIAFLTSVAEHVGEEAKYLHWGMTSSDLLDTAFAIQLRRATDIILQDLSGLMAAVKDQAFRHKKTICVARSHGIHAEPTTFGLKVAGWYAELDRQKLRIERAKEEISTAAISGPVGTYAHLSPDVEAHVCRVFGLTPAPISTQVISRDVHAHLFLSFAQLAATVERVAVEIRHLQRTEVREAEENFTKGQKGSSAMPHKRNPILTENVTGLSRIIRTLAESSLENIPLWHERDISHSSAERFIAPDITVTLDFLLVRMTGVVRDLQVYPDKMKRNLNYTQGLVYSATLLPVLAARATSREEAYRIVQEHALKTWEDLDDPAKAGGSLFLERLKSDQRITSVLSGDELNEIFSEERHLKHVDFIFRRVFGSC